MRARKAHACTACKGPIPAGHEYVRHVIIDEAGDKPSVTKRCMRCDAVYEHLLSITDCYNQPKPALNCGHEYTEVHGHEPPPEIAALAFWLPGDPL